MCKIGMTDSCINLDKWCVCCSNTWSISRFDLMSYDKDKCENTQIVSDSYLNEATTTSQAINEAYGYLWWLNRKSSYHLPGLQVQFNGQLVPNAPADMYAAWGKNDQKIYVVPSEKLVVIRMGEVANPDNPTFALSGFDNELWGKINALVNQ